MSFQATVAGTDWKLNEKDTNCPPRCCTSLNCGHSLRHLITYKGIFKKENIPSGDVNKTLRDDTCTDLNFF